MKNKQKNESAGEPLAITRRRTAQFALLGLGAALGSPLLSGCNKLMSSDKAGFALNPPDKNGLHLPDGFTSRIVARSGEPVLPGAAFRWHGSPDGGAVFDAPDGGWVYVSNSELPNGAGGVSAIRFDASGTIVDAYTILSGTTDNCAGGKTPWNTWLSCEESGDLGRVFECDPFGVAPAVERPALGRCNHEAVAVDYNQKTLYLTEDNPDGRLYRFTPDNYPDLGSGVLELAEMHKEGSNDVLVWHRVPDPSGASKPTRYQVAASQPFNGGEGIAYADGVIYFTTKGDNRVWRYNVATAVIDILYDNAGSVLTGVDNITIAPSGEIFVAEDDGNMQIVALTTSGGLRPVVQVLGHPLSEVTGPALHENGLKLYFSSQRGETNSLTTGGVTYEVTGSFS